MTRILITGAAGAVGQALLDELAFLSSEHSVVATDIRTPCNLPSGVVYEKLDVRENDPDRIIGKYRPEVVVHLASIVTPPKGSTRDFEFSVDVTGTHNVLNACIRYGVRRIVVTSSGAAYGYHADNLVPLREGDPLRGNQEFAYAHHKRLVEEMLAEARKTTPQLKQVVLRVGTVLGAGLENQITRLFHRKWLIGVSGSQSPFVFIWLKDLGLILLRAVTHSPPGIFNVAADGTMGIDDLSRALNKPVLRLPAWLLKLALGIACLLGLSSYGAEHVRFLQYRPVLDNARLKTVFGYTPEKTASEVFALWQAAAGL